MKRNWRGRKTGKVLAAALVTLLSAGLFAACGKISSKDVPKSDPSFEFYWNGSAVMPAKDYGPVIRANGRDTITVGARVKGARSNVVYFFIPDAWATFPGCTTTDGWCGVYADSMTGLANVIMQSKSVAGRAELMATASTGTASLLVTFDFATLTLFPSVVVLGTDSSDAVVEARGGLVPIEWWISRPEQVNFHIRDETSVVVYTLDIADPLTGATGTPPEPAVLYARDAEGSVATANIYTSTSNCVASTLTVTPSTADNVANASISVVVEDYDQRDKSSVTVSMTNESTGVTTTLTLTQWLVPGLFQASTTLTFPANPATIVFEYVDDQGADCRPDTIRTTFSWT